MSSRYTSAVPDFLAEKMDDGLRAERDRLVREVVYLRTGQMIGGGGDELDLATRIAQSQADQVRAARADLASTMELVHQLRDELHAAEAREALLQSRLRRIEHSAPWRVRAAAKSILRRVRT